MKFIRPQHFDVVTDDIVKTLLKIAFFISPMAVWKISELVVEVFKWASKL